jgi:hypothetical protein
MEVSYKNVYTLMGPYVLAMFQSGKDQSIGAKHLGGSTCIPCLDFFVQRYTWHTQLALDAAAAADMMRSANGEVTQRIARDILSHFLLGMVPGPGLARPGPAQTRIGSGFGFPFLHLRVTYFLRFFWTRIVRVI